MLLNELKAVIHKMVDEISDKNMLIKIYTFIKYLKQQEIISVADGVPGAVIPAPAYCLTAYVKSF